jgi:hypothetical protein
MFGVLGWILFGLIVGALAKLVMMCFKYARTRADFLEILGRWMGVGVVREVHSAPNGLEALARVMRYILLVSEHVKQDVLQEFLEHNLGPDAKDAIMTAGQQLIEQGIEQGRQQGAQGVLLRMLRRRFGVEVDAHIEQRIAAASVERIEAWSERVLSATTLAELFDD